MITATVVLKRCRTSAVIAVANVPITSALTQYSVRIAIRIAKRQVCPRSRLFRPPSLNLLSSHDLV